MMHLTFLASSRMDAVRNSSRQAATILAYISSHVTFMGISVWE